MRVVIVVPFYKSSINYYEAISICQLLRVLCNYDIIFIKPQDIVREDIISGMRKHGIRMEDPRFISFPGSYFRSPQTYNRLLTSLEYFNAFKMYDFILMHHPDAYVFRDELEYWCKQNFDYIGAPIYEYNGTMRPQKYLGIGNGGFSMHKVESALRVLTTYRRIYPIRDLLEWYLKYNWRGRLKLLPYLIRIASGLGGNSHHHFNYLRLNEDIFWGIFVPNAFDWYKVPSYSVAARFSMEYNCEKLLKENNGHLPFGCHRWYKGEFLSFWRQFINTEAFE